MPNGVSRGFSRWFGFGKGPGSGRGMGFGFRGSSPPWPYVGLGRGGLPRCSYFFGGAAGAPPAWPHQPAYPFYGGAPATPFTPQMTRGEELDFLKNQAEAVKEELEQIEKRARDLESE